MACRYTIHFTTLGISCIIDLFGFGFGMLDCLCCGEDVLSKSAHA
jgi:hypothetical protein